MRADRGNDRAAWLGVLIFGIGFAPLAHAANSADGTPFGESIAVSGDYDGSAGTSDAASEGKASRQSIEDRPLLRPGAVLELVPGLIVTQHSGAGKANQYFLRGFNLDHGTDFATTVDGMPVNMRTHAHGQGYTDLNFVIPELIQHIDYFKGPYFASKGDFASAGAADISYATRLPSSMALLSRGNDGYGRLLAAGWPSIGDGHLLYGLELFHDDGPWQNPDDYRKLNAVLRYSRRVGLNDLSLTAMGYSGEWNSTDQIPLRAIDAIGRFGAVDPTDGGKSWRYSLSGDIQRELGGGVLTASVYGIRYKLTLFSDFTYFLDDPIHGDQFEQADDRWIFGTSGRYDWDSDKLRASVGWEARHDRIDPIGLYDTQARSRFATVRQDFVRETSGALFAEAEARPLRWVRAIAGVRYDHYFFAVDSDNSANTGNAAAGRASPKGSLILGPWQRTELFVDAGFGFHSNDARGVLTTVDPKTGALVKPVTPLVATRGAEVGVRTQIVPATELSVSLWRLDLDSELVFSGDAGSTEPSRASRRQGLEVSSLIRPMRWLMLDFDLALSSSRFTSPDPDRAVLGTHIPGSIETVLSAGATARGLGPFSASLFARYFGPRPLVEDNSVRSSASTSFDAQASYRLTSWARLTADVFNLFDAHVDDIAYFYASRLRGEPSAVDDVHIHPAARRSFRLAAMLTY
ncbi:MAG TPA: TonB-dependent receptor [Myxococcales bacterium]|jgi:hypothetical protein